MKQVIFMVSTAKGTQPRVPSVAEHETVKRRTPGIRQFGAGSFLLADPRWVGNLGCLPRF
jgi:hypothetical protein